MRQLLLPFMGRQSGKTRYTIEQKNRWEALFREGKSYREIADLEDVPFGTVHHEIHRVRALNDGRKAGRRRQYAFDTERERLKDGRLRKMYGVTLDWFREAYRQQGGLCAICQQEPGGFVNQFGGKEMHVDHNHKTGKVRQLLCSNCNTGLGKFADSPELLEAAAVYLRRHI